MAHLSSAFDFNRILAPLSPAERQTLQRDLDWVEMPQGATLHEAGVEPRYVYFPATAVVSLVASLRNGSSSELAMVGNEGVVGVSGFLGGRSTQSRALVHGGGYGLRMTARDLARHARRSPEVMKQLLTYTQALMTHIGQTAACNRHHAIDQQFCRWLLLNLDRRLDSEVAVTQERIADLLGVRRETVTAGAVKLQKAGLIRYGRGRIAIVDRPRLEAAACECYALIRRAYDGEDGGRRERTWSADDRRAPGLRRSLSLSPMS